MTTVEISRGVRLASMLNNTATEEDADLVVAAVDSFLAAKPKSAGASVTLEFETETRYECTECGEVDESFTEGPIYECSECGEKFSREEGGGKGNVSPCCTKLSSKVLDADAKACNSCKAEVEEKEMVEIGGEYVGVDALEDHIKNALGIG